MPAVAGRAPRAIGDDDVSLARIFPGSTPYRVMLLMVLVAINFVPGIATCLPGPLR